MYHPNSYPVVTVNLALQGQATLELDKLLPSVLFQLGATLDEMLLNPLLKRKEVLNFRILITTNPFLKNE
jgi:hypothetical protein